MNTVSPAWHAFCARTRAALAAPLPGFAAQREMMPPGRVVPPDLSGARIGAVLVLLYPVQDAPTVILTLRSDQLDRHRGQVSFPGGRRDPTDPDLTAAALRETREELGVDDGALTVLGALTPLYIPPSNYLIHPFVAAAPARPTFTPNPGEVAGLIEVGLDDLRAPYTRGVAAMPITRNGTTEILQMPHFVVGPHRVWGATAMVLCELLATIGA
ncbi:MAG: CoA pyrophosphatase [Thermoflexales bacterium]|nr:CoA pyrophosphatase [Thermoflexales bacterium]